MHPPPLLPLSLLLLLFPLLSLLPLTDADCIPCRYGASTVVCPQPNGVSPENAMTDFTCLCGKQSQYESVLASCFGTKDLPSSCDPNDDSELKRIREACKGTSTKVEETKAGTTKTKTETETMQEDTVIQIVPTTGGKKTTLVEGQTTYTVTYFTSISSLSSGSLGGGSSVGNAAGLKTGSATMAFPSGSGISTGTSRGDDDPNGNNSAKRVVTIIGASIGAVVGVVLIGIAFVETRKQLKISSENRRVARELNEVMRGGGGVGYGQRDGPAELEGERRAELAG